MRIAIVNDVPMAIETLRRIVQNAPGHEIAWIARNGSQAVEYCAQDTPDLILMDLIMPQMDGVEATRRIMASTPCAVLIVTATVEGQAARVFEALGAGALDVVSTPVLTGRESDAESLLAKLQIMERLGRTGGLRNTNHESQIGHDASKSLIVIGASAGGPAALAAILSKLPAAFPAAIVIVQHVDAQFAASMADWLDDQSPLRVRPAREGDEPRAGEVLLAATNDHLIFTNSRTLGYTTEPQACSYRPSIDVFFESVARRYRGSLIGILLTGMGRDGAKGLKCLRDCGALTIAQDQSTCVVYGMPKAAVSINAASEILPLDEIAPRLRRLCRRRR